jgi:hypothetical protein
LQIRNDILAIYYHVFYRSLPFEMKIDQNLEVRLQE